MTHSPGRTQKSLDTFSDTQVLHLSEHAAYGRIEAARAARRFPLLLDLLADGTVTLTSVCLLAPHLTIENHREVLASARYKTKRELELIVAGQQPRPPVPATIRKLPASNTTTTAPPLAELEHAAPAPSAPLERPAVVTPLAPEHYKLQVTLSADTYASLRRAQDLMRHAVPNGDVSVIIDRALKMLVRELERQKFAATDRPRTARRTTRTPSRYIPADVRRRVWQRDGGQCAFVGTQGRCTERGFLEFHHLQPYADGGKTVIENLELRCRAHNAYEAQRWDGTLFVREEREVYSVLDRVATAKCERATSALGPSGMESTTRLLNLVPPRATAPRHVQPRVP
jgi:5-methylcytosine-specific restriction endonuclease McrA